MSADTIMGLAATGGETALSVFVAVVLGGAFVVLGVVCWVFWRAAKREPR